MNTPGDCRRCGVCCFSSLADYVPVRGEDWSRLGPDADAVAHFIGQRAFMRMTGNHCAALRIQTGADGAADFSCSVYARRPQACRDLDRGAAACEGEIAVKGVRVAVFAQAWHGLSVADRPADVQAFAHGFRMNPTSRKLFGWLAAAFLLAGSAVAMLAATTPRPPNILFIIADDLRPELGSYGVKGIKTPNLDALAARSVQFNDAHVQYALCNPSRSSLLTGRYPTQTGVMDNRQWWGLHHENWRTLPRWFRDHGYTTLREGKIFHEGIDDETAWVEGGQARRYPDDASERLDGANRDPNTKQPGETGNRASGSDRFVVLEGNGETYQDYQHATRTIELLRKYKGGEQPFFMACGFTNPHSPPRAPQKFYDLYDINKMTLPPDFATHPTVPKGFPELSVVPRNTDLFIGRESSEAEAREMKRAYWASVSYMDDNVGRVLRALDELGLRDNTIVVFWGDHGYHLGEKGRWSKAYSLWDVATRAPLMIAAPGVTPKNGAVCDRPVELINLYRTFCDLAGLPAPEGVEGASMAPLLRNPAAAWDRPAYTVVQYRGHQGRAVATERWHFAEWDKGEGGAMLIDRRRDPLELTNLADDPAHARDKAAMKALLAKLPE